MAKLNIVANIKSKLKDGFNYHTYEANGRIAITDHLIDAFENAPSSIKPQQYRQAAKGSYDIEFSPEQKQPIPQVLWCNVKH